MKPRVDAGFFVYCCSQLFVDTYAEFPFLAAL